MLAQRTENDVVSGMSVAALRQDLRPDRVEARLLLFELCRRRCQCGDQEAPVGTDRTERR
jgi:hypothetical protein